MIARFGAPKVTVVWIDARRAIVARWDTGATVETIESDVPARHRSTGHQRLDPRIRHGGGGPATDRIERDREGHLRVFVGDVVARLPVDDDLLILGPGQVREMLIAEVHRSDEAHRRLRIARTEPAGPLTVRQLVARARESSGDAPRRRRIRAAGIA